MSRSKIIDSSAATLQDVADRASVSLSTASRVLSHSDYPVSEELSKRILKAARDLNYTPNLLGRMLKTNSTMSIGVVVPTLQNPFFHQVILGIESAARSSDYELTIFSSHRSVEQERKNILTCLKNRIMALVVVSIDKSPDTINRYIEYGGHVALIEADFELQNAIVSKTEYQEAGRIAVRHLIENGHRDIAFLTAPLTKTSRRQLLDGVKMELAQQNIPFTDEDLIVGQLEKETDNGQYEFVLGKSLANDFLSSRKNHTAIIALNDLMAFGVIQELTLCGISVPEQVSVISFDNLSYSEMIAPPLTTVELPSNSMGFTACQMLISSMSSRDIPAQMSFSFPCRLIPRKSVKNLND